MTAHGTPERMGRYQVRGKLGEGAMSVVFDAFDPVIQRTVALKAVSKAFLGPVEAAVILGRFKREAQAAGRLVHPNIVAIFEYGEDPDFAFIAMEFVPGRSLLLEIARSPRMSLARVKDLASQLLDALAYSHSQGVVHRDLKPANLLVNDAGQLKISDFGIARIEASNLTQDGDVLGTPNYMAPEQFLGVTADARSDVYSAGIIIYELLTGRRPFDGTTAAIMRQVLEVKPRAPSEVDPAIPPVFDAVLAKALTKQPEDRYQSAPEFLADLLQAFDAALPEEPASEGTPAPALKLSRGMLEAIRRAGAQLPATGAPAPVPQPPTEPGFDTRVLHVENSGGPKLRVLFVDDEERILNAVRSVFRDRYHVFTATDGAQAVEFVRRFRVHVCVSDQRMPGMKGVDLLREIKAVSPNTVRILLTGYSDLAAIVGSINDGEVYRFVSKPWNNQELLDIVGEAAAISLELEQGSTVQGARMATKSEAALLVIDEKDEMFRAAHELMSGTCPVVRAARVEDALRIMQEREVGVLVTDIGAGHEDNVTLLKLLKQEYPQILSIVLTSASDSELVIELINQAQIFRFLNKPVNVKLMKFHIDAAFGRYESFRTSPHLLKAQKVHVGVAALQSSIGRSILQGLQSLKGRFAAAFGGRSPS